MTQIIYSQRPELCVKVLNNEASVLVVNSVPAFVKEWLKDTSKPFPEMEVFIYCTKNKSNKDILLDTAEEDPTDLPFEKRYWLGSEAEANKLDGEEIFESGAYSNQLVVAKFTLKNVSSLYNQPNEFLDARKYSCLTPEQCREYAHGKDLFALYITDLVVFDKPKELGEFYKSNQWITSRQNWKEYGYSYDEYLSQFEPITKAPQSWQYCVYESEEK